MFKWEPYKRWFESCKEINRGRGVYGSGNWVNDSVVKPR